MTKYQHTLRHTASERLGIPPPGRSGRLSHETPPTAVERWLTQQLHKTLGNPEIQIVLWNGEAIPAHDTPCPRLYLRERQCLWQLLVNPDLYFGDAFTQGQLEVEGDLVDFLERVYRAAFTVKEQNPMLNILGHWRNRAQHNTTTETPDNINHHYNLGNDFYALWLDEEMVYTCAYFPESSLTLEQAQQAKMDHVCRKLRLQPGETVMEAGCGWGALARHMAKHYAVRVRAFNLAHEQIVYAKQRAAAEGLAGQVEFIEDDYRNITGQCDAFVSVGMLEHVGRDNYTTLGAVIDRCLSPQGRGLIHSIARDQPYPMNAWIEQRIFPGSYPPTLREMMEVFEPWGFSVQDVENLRLHYAKTLEHWLHRFDAQEAVVRGLFDAAFVRAWRLYLAGSLAGFTTGWLQLFQVVFTRPGVNSLPWTRAHLYLKQA